MSAWRSFVRSVRRERTALANERADEARLREQIREMETELASLGLARSARGAVELPRGTKLRQASPCPEAWVGMVGDERVRRCARCDARVYDLVGLSASEADAVLRRHDETPRRRVYQRADGTLLRADCPMGRPRTTARRVLLVVALVVGALAVAERLGHAGPEERTHPGDADGAD